MTTATENWIELGVGVGVVRRDPVPSKLWVQVRTFHYKKDAVAWAVENGFSRSSVQRRYGRVVYANVIVSGTEVLGE